MAEKKEYNVGDTFKVKKGKHEYTIVATFEDNGETFFVAKKPSGYGSWYYSNIFCYNENGELFQRS